MQKGQIKGIESENTSNGQTFFVTYNVFINKSID